MEKAIFDTCFKALLEYDRRQEREMLSDVTERSFRWLVECYKAPQDTQKPEDEIAERIVEALVDYDISARRDQLLEMAYTGVLSYHPAEFIEGYLKGRDELDKKLKAALSWWYHVVKTG